MMMRCGVMYWADVLGYHVLDVRKSFCEINQLSIMNTWFQKKKQHYGSWMHPG